MSTVSGRPSGVEGKGAGAGTREEASFAETALKLGGKSQDEARRTGAIDKADDQVESLFLPQYQTVNSPVHRAVWEHKVPVELFKPSKEQSDSAVLKVMEESIAIVRRRRKEGRLLNGEGKLADDLLEELGSAGYWGLLVDKEYGGSGAAFRTFAPFLTRMAIEDPTVSGMASVHGCIGAVDPVRTFGSAAQKQEFLPRLASGKSLSAFALTEPCAGSDLTALRTKAVLDGDDYVVTGEKLFITNVRCGRTIGLVCLIDEKPSVLIVDLPHQENEQFQLRKYGLYALKRTYNQGLIFRGLRVPKQNLLTAPLGDGLTIAYHGLNLGRVALCAGASGNMRTMLASMIPWGAFRVTYGEPIGRRELVRRRLGKLAGMIVSCDALVHWCASLIDQGYRGEMECVVAKIYGSECQKEAAIDLCMKTHGGRSFLQGHLVGDHIHEFLAPCIYEGEGEMLGMAFFKSLVKQHGKQFFEPIGKAQQAAGIKKPNMMNPAHLWALRQGLVPYAKWYLARRWHGVGDTRISELRGDFRELAEFAAAFLQRGALDISDTMTKHQLKLADRQCRMAELSARYQTAIVMLTSCLYAAAHASELVREAALTRCFELRAQLLGHRPTDRELRRVTSLGEEIAKNPQDLLMGAEAAEILMGY